MTKRRPWTGQEVETLRALYPDFPAEIVARQLDRPVRSIYFKAKALRLFKSEAFKASDLSRRIRRGQQSPAMVAHHFKPGFTPWNKGMKGLRYAGSQPTQFKRGNAPHNTLPIGSYRIGSDGLWERKVNNLPGANNVRWHTAHRLAWEAVHGPVPPGHICVFKPGMRTTVLEDITAERVECITRAENARRNHPRSRSPELGRLVQIKGAITRQVNRITREAQEATS